IPLVAAAADDVPQNSTALPPRSVVRLHPGAAVVIQPPAFDHGYSEPSAASAATEITPGSAAGYVASTPPALPDAATTTMSAAIARATAASTAGSSPSRVR